MSFISRLFGRPDAAPAISAHDAYKALYPDKSQQDDEAPKPGERKLAKMLPSWSHTGNWTDDRIKQVHHFTYWYYVGANAICKKMASLGSPNIGWVNSTPQARKSGSMRNRVWKKSQDVIKPHEEVEHVPLNHPALKLFNRPNAYDVNYDLWYELTMFKLLTGSTYLWTSARNGLDLPAELWVAPSHWMFPRGSQDRLIDYYEMRPYGGSAGMQRLDPRDVLHMRSKNPRNKIDGLSQASAGAKWIDTSESVDTARWAQMENQMRPEIVVTLKPDVNPDDDEFTRYYAKLQQRFGGKMKTGLPMFLSGVEDVVPIQYPAEIFYISTAEQMRDFVLCGLLNVPKEVLGMQPSGSDLSWWAPLHTFCMQAINPETRYLGQVLTRWLQQYDPDLRAWWDDCTPDNPDQVNKDIAADFAAGAITPNEIRSQRGREDYEHGGDDPLLPTTLSPFPLNTGEDLSGLGDLIPTPGGAEPEPQVDAFGNPMLAEQGGLIPPPGVPQEEAKPADPVEATADGMARVSAILGRPLTGGMDDAREVFAAGVNRLRNPTKSVKPKPVELSGPELLRRELHKALREEPCTTTLPTPSRNGLHSTATK